MSYAKNTTVTTGQSEIQIKKMLKKHGANSVMIGEDETRLAIMFTMNARQIKFIVPIPQRDDEDIKYTDGGKTRSESAIDSAIDQATRQRYRLLFLVVKAKLEAVESLVVSFEDEFLAHTVMADGKTVSEWVSPQISIMYDTGDMPPLLGYEGGK